jgi:calcineurin-like phosphoesterase family protein
MNIHGHFHNNSVDRWEYNTYEKHRLLAIENTGYQPVLIDKIEKLTTSIVHQADRNLSYWIGESDEKFLKIGSGE